MHISKKGLLTCLAMTALSMGILTSCSDDEDLDNGGTVTVVKPTEASNFDGTRLITVSGEDGSYPTKFSYNADGSLSQIVNEDRDGDYEKVIFDYTTGSITFAEMYNNEYSEEKAQFKTNDKGYITEVSGSDSDEDGKWNVIYKFQYNGAGHLTNVAANEVYTNLETNEKETTDVTWELTWNGDLLSTVKCNGFDGTERWGGTSNYSYTDAVDNRCMQYTSEIIDDLDFDGGVEDFMYAGLFGKASSKYPSKIEDDDEDVYNLTYDLNSKGLVEKETCTSSGPYGSHTYATVYSYDGISKAAAPAAGNKAGVDKKRNKDSRSHIRLFRSKK